MNVLFVSSEAAPFAKVGGLADVVGALPRALRTLGIDARIIMPRYEHLRPLPRSDLLLENVEITLGNKREWVKVFRTALPGSEVTVYLVDNETYLSHGPIYNDRGTEGQFTELSRFLFFNKAVVSIIPKLGWMPHIIHAHDWHSGLIPALLAQVGLEGIKSIFTIHNLAHQGVWNPDDVFAFLGISPKLHPNFAERDGRGDFNVMQQGILGATRVNTVSPQYAREIVTSEYGFGLDKTLRRREKDLVGILNGIDMTQFNPATDRFIRVHYDRSTVERKVENKLALHERCGFRPDPTIPTFGFVGRLTEQKGIDLIAANSTMFVDAGARLVLLGTGNPEFEQRAQKLGQQHPQAICTHVGFNASFAQHIYAGADFLLMPSRFEPCGIGQMIAMRYGTPAIVRATGGLKNTVPDIDVHPDTGLGFSFDNYERGALWQAVARALERYRRPREWRTLIERCMAQDFSWNRSARSYLELYEQTR